MGIPLDVERSSDVIHDKEQRTMVASFDDCDGADDYGSAYDGGVVGRWRWCSEQWWRRLTMVMAQRTMVASSD